MDKEIKKVKRRKYSEVLWSPKEFLDRYRDQKYRLQII